MADAQPVAGGAGADIKVIQTKGITPPFWSDRISIFANMGMILFGLSLTVRGRDLIAMQALYEKVSPAFALMLDATWNAVILVFSVIFAWYGVEAAVNMPGQYWDFQDFCLDMDLTETGAGSILFTILKSFEGINGSSLADDTENTDP